MVLIWSLAGCAGLQLIPVPRGGGGGGGYASGPVGTFVTKIDITEGWLVVETCELVQREENLEQAGCTSATHSLSDQDEP
jgi:hypothetical protein